MIKELDFECNNYTVIEEYEDLLFDEYDDIEYLNELGFHEVNTMESEVIEI